MQQIISFSGFACNGKTTLMKELSSDGFVFLEHAGMCLEIGKDMLLTYDENNLMPFQCSLFSTEIDRIKTWQINRKHMNKNIYCDRNLLDPITFAYYHAERTKKIPNEKIISNLPEVIAKFISKTVDIFPIYDKIFLIKPNEKEEYIYQNCVRKDRLDTINVKNFIEDEKWWFNKYLEIYAIFENIIPKYSTELIIIDHPSKIGFDEFYKQIFKKIG